MKKLLFVDYSNDGERIKSIRTALNDTNIEVFMFAFELEQYINNNKLCSNDLICLHISNPSIVPDACKSKEDAAFPAIRRSARRYNHIPVFLHTGGHIENGVSINVDDSTIIFNFNWLVDHIRYLLKEWNNCQSIGDYINVIKQSLSIDKLTNVFSPLDILIQCYLTVHGAARGNPWEWLRNNESMPLMLDSMIGPKLAKQRLGEIEKDPFKWFKPAVESLKEVFPPDNPQGNEKLEKALANMPNPLKELLTHSELIEFSKFIMSVYHQQER